MNVSRTTLRSALLCSVLFTAIGVDARAGEGTKSDHEAQVARGRYLVSIAGCSDCHTPLKMGANGPEPDMERFLSGHPAAMTMPPAPALGEGPWMVSGAATLTAWSGPWGVSFSANLTSDVETGIGAWTADEFLAMARTGRHLGKGRPVLPPMPTVSLMAMTDEDVLAVFAYLQSVPAVSNRVPAPLPPAPAKS